MIFVDTNYFLRFLLKDIDNQHLAAKKLFKEGAEGKLKLFTSTLVFFEIFWVLTSYYGKDKNQLVQTLRELLQLEFIKLYERPLLKSSVELFQQTNLSLEDCYNLHYAQAKEAQGFKTFDEKLTKSFSSFSFK